MDDQRYIRHIQFKDIGQKGQAMLGRSRVAIVGQGALGCASSNYLARAGVGFLRVIDADCVDWSNLQRQILFDEGDIGKEKASAAYDHLQSINSDIEIQPVNSYLDKDNAMDILGDVDLVVDATDNFEAREIINQVCVDRQIPWIYCGVVGSKGMTMNMLPGGPCLRCVMADGSPKPGEYPVASTAGVIGSLPPLFSAIQCTEAVKILIGAHTIRRTLLYIDIWANTFEEVEVRRNPYCKICGD